MPFDDPGNPRPRRSIRLSTGLILLAVIALAVWGAQYVMDYARERRAERETAEKLGNVIPIGAARNVRNAEKLVEEGKPHLALEKLLLALERAPDSSAINSAVGGLYYLLGEMSRARVHLERAHEIEPDNKAAARELALVSSLFGRPERAFRLVGSVLDQADDPRQLHERYQDYGLAAGKGEELRTYYEERLRLTGPTGDTVFLQARLETDPGMQAVMMRAALAVDKDHVEARSSLIFCLLGARDYPAARAECARLPPASPGRENGPVMRALFAVSTGKAEEALKILDAAVKAGCVGPQIRFMRSAVLSALGRHGDALDELDHLQLKVPSGGPDAAFLTLYQVRALVDRGDAPAARKLLEERIKLIKDWTPFHRLCIGRAEGRISWYEGHLQSALCAFIDCPDIDFVILGSATARLNEGILFARLGRPEKARIAWMRLADTHGPEVRFDPARLAAKMFAGKLEPAKFLEAVKREARFYDNDAWFHVGLYHEFAGRQDEAKAAYRAAVEKSIGNDWPRHLAEEALKRMR